MHKVLAMAPTFQTGKVYLLVFVVVSHSLIRLLDVAIRYMTNHFNDAAYNLMTLSVFYC